MLIVFLLYHYDHAEEVNNSIRIITTCYIWIAAFGHFSFFYKKPDYSIVRVLQMLWRSNFLVLFLCLTQGTTYIFYYLCLLHTYYFFMVYITMRIGKEYNYTKYWIRTKLLLLAVLLYFVWDVHSGLFQLLHGPFFHTVPQLGATSGALYEWYFRTTLDHWSTFWGMLFAFNFPITSLLFHKLESSPPSLPTQRRQLQLYGVKLVMAVMLGCAFGWWLRILFRLEKHQYNLVNAYYGLIPILAYVYFRNVTLKLRSYSFELLHQIGKTTLETYLMHHHIWLTSNAKSILTLIPGWPKINFLLVTILYVMVCRRLHSITLFLRGMILPENKRACLRNLGVMVFVICAYIAWAYFLQSMQLLKLSTVGICTIVFGSFLYYCIIQQTWTSYTVTVDTVLRTSLPSIQTNAYSYNNHNNRNGKNLDSSDSKSNIFPIARATSSCNNTNNVKTISFIALCAGTMSILFFGFIWNHALLHGASTIQRPLPSSCKHYIHRGSWVPLDSCNNAQTLGSIYRKYDISFLGTCSSPQAPSPLSFSYVWGWYSTPSNSHCRFTYKNPTTLTNQLQHRIVTFVGDSTIRHLFYSFCRQLGHVHAGAYNTTHEKHADIAACSTSTTNISSTTQVNFIWAPYVTNLTSFVGDVVKAQSKSGTIHSTSNIAGMPHILVPNVLILGGGAWDRLHLYNSISEQDKLHKDIQTLVGTIRNLNAQGAASVSTTWVTPTMTNTWALPSEEKRKNIPEDQMELLRQKHAELGIHDVVSFVLDGKAYTADRVLDSYDGVHYPLHVYDAGSQILANALDWLLPLDRNQNDLPQPPQLGGMANPILGAVMLLLVAISVFGMDGFFGISYLALWLVHLTDLSAHLNIITPRRLYYESFSSFHNRLNLPPIPPELSFPTSDNKTKQIHQNYSRTNGSGPNSYISGSHYVEKSKSSEGDPVNIEELEPFFFVSR